MTDLSAYGGLGRSGPLWPESWRRRLPDMSAGGLLVAAVVWLGIVALAQPDGSRLGTGQEAISYWGPRLDAMYANGAWTTTGAYVYSPAFLQVIAPLKVLPWVAFLGVWTAILMVAVRYLTGRRLFAIGILLATAELAGGNISLLLAAAIVVGFRWPAAWALILLTKVSPGIGLLWFAVRREWRNLGIAFAATAAVIAVSVVIKPGAWLEWFDVLSSIPGGDPPWGALPSCGGGRAPAWGGAPAPPPGPPADRHRGRRVGRQDGSTLDGSRRLHAGAPGAVVRRPDDAARGHRPSAAGRVRAARRRTGGVGITSGTGGQNSTGVGG